MRHCGEVVACVVVWGNCRASLTLNLSLTRGCRDARRSPKRPLTTILHHQHHRYASERQVSRVAFFFVSCSTKIFEPIVVSACARIARGGTNKRLVPPEPTAMSSDPTANEQIYGGLCDTPVSLPLRQPARFEPRYPHAGCRIPSIPCFEHSNGHEVPLFQRHLISLTPETKYRLSIAKGTIW